LFDCPLSPPPNNFPKKNLKIKKIYSPENKKIVARVALLTGCVQRVISPEINESTIRLLNRHNVEVVVLPEIKCCGSLNHHLGKKDLAHSSFSKNINLWYEEYLKNGLDAIISNTSGCGTTLKDYGFIFRNNKDLKKKAKKISELSKDVTEYIDESLDLKFEKKRKSLKKIVDMQINKTGKLFSFCCMAPIILSKKNKYLNLFNSIGSKIGLLFQIADDLIDYSGSTKKAGKKTRKDSKKGKATLIGLLGYKNTVKYGDRLKLEILNKIKKFGNKNKDLSDTINYILIRTK